MMHLFIYIIYSWVFCQHVPHACLLYTKDRRGCRIIWKWNQGVLRVSTEFFKLNPEPGQEEQVLLITVQSLHPCFLFICVCTFAYMFFFIFYISIPINASHFSPLFTSSPTPYFYTPIPYLSSSIVSLQTGRSPMDTSLMS